MILSRNEIKMNEILQFDDFPVRRAYDEDKQVWYFSVTDVIRVLLQHQDIQLSRNYWKVLKSRLKKEGSESVTNCNRLKLTAEDGKKYLTDVADIQTLFRIIQSVPSPKAEPIKLWLRLPWRFQNLKNDIFHLLYPDKSRALSLLLK